MVDYTLENSKSIIERKIEEKVTYTQDFTLKDIIKILKEELTTYKDFNFSQSALKYQKILQEYDHFKK